MYPVDHQNADAHEHKYEKATTIFQQNNKTNARKKGKEKNEHEENTNVPTTSVQIDLFHRVENYVNTCNKTSSSILANKK